MTWNTFDRDREHLEAQYLEPAWDEASGWGLDKLEDAVAQIVQDAEQQGQPRIRTKAAAFELILLNGQIEVDPKDWFADRLQHGGLVRGIRNAWTAEIRQTVIAEASDTAVIARSVGALIAGPNFSHTSPDWERVLSLGPSGLLDFIRETRDSKLAAGCLSETERDFYDATETVYVAFIRFILRLAEGAEKQAELHSEERERMLALAQCLRNIATRPPETLYEALQLAYLCHELMEMEGESVRSMGGFDRLYYRFYRSDIERGLHTREQEQELIKYFFIKFFAKTGGQEYGKNFVFGGIDVDGSDAINPLSYAALDAYEEMWTVNPKLSIRVHEGTPADFLRQVVSCIRKGCNSFVLANDDVGIASLVKRGTPEEDARNYVLMGCYEPAIMGKEVPCSGSQWVNMAKAVEWALYDGVDPLTGRQMGPNTGECETFASFDEFYAAFKTQLSQLLEGALDVQVAFESHWTEMNSSPLLSGTMLECVENGRDIAAGGAKYNNTGSCVGSLASTVDSLVAIRELVFERKAITMSVLAETLRNDWADNELLRLKILSSRRKFGNNLEEPDALAREITDFIARIINSRRNERGGRFCAALNSIDHCVTLGKAVGALPDGRRAHEPLSKNLSAVTGMDREGVTALINSVTRLDFTQFPNGSVLDIMLHPTAVQGEEGLSAMVGLIRSYFAQGGFAIQFNIFDVNTLREAQERPEEHANLQVRVCGWNVHFVNLSETEQDMFIEQAENLLA
jgi:formate C-acetyltransferase